MKNKWKVPYLDLPAQYKNQKKELDSEFKRIMSEGSFILRKDVEDFEANIAAFMNVKHVIGVNSGTDALYLSLKALKLKRGDEVITTALLPYSTFAALNAGAEPVFIDVGEDFNMDVTKLEAAITPQTKVIIPVHLNGRACQIDKIMEIANKHNIIVIEDAAQSFGSEYNKKKTGTYGLAGCFSVHPMKNLSCAGDGGFIITNDDEMDKKLRALRNLGKETRTEFSDFGFNSRLDNLQAAILNVKLKKVKKYIGRRRKVAYEYSEKLSGLPLMLPPPPFSTSLYDSNAIPDEPFYDTYNSYIIRCQNQKELLEYLKEKKIEVFVHYPTPSYKIRGLNLKDFNLPMTEKICKEVISIPINPSMDKKQVDYVIKIIEGFFKTKRFINP